MDSIKNEWQRYSAVLGRDMPKLAEFAALKGAGDERLVFLELDYSRRKALLDDPSLALPNAARATIAAEKFTKYIFNPDNRDGYPKGVSFMRRLGYNINNWGLMQEEILHSALANPAEFQLEDEYGKRYQQCVVLHGLRNRPADVKVGWKVKDGRTWMTTVYMG